MRALYNILRRSYEQAASQQMAEGAAGGAAPEDAALKLALILDRAVKQHRPDGWRGIQAKEQIVKRAIYDVVQNVDEAERLFPIIKQQAEY